MPRLLPENAPYRLKKWRELMDLKAQIARDLRHEYAVNQCLLEPEEFPECGAPFKQYTQWILNQRRSSLS